MSVALLNARKQEVIAKVNECVEKGNKMFGVTLPKLDIRFDLTGATAGQACYNGWKFYLRFNTDMMLRDSWDDMIGDTVPHEVAHSFCQVYTHLGRQHDAGWKNVCQRLGGSGKRCHDEDVVYSRGRTFEYTSTTGQQQRVSERIHARIQKGSSVSYRKGGGTVNKSCAFTIVGVQGRTLTNPVVPRTPAPAPAAVPFFPAVQKPRKEVVFDPVAIAAAVAALAATKGAVPCLDSVKPLRSAPVAGESKADTARRIMVQGHAAGHNYETILQAIMTANGHDRRLAASYYKNNAPKVGVPLP